MTAGLEDARRHLAGRFEGRDAVAQVTEEGVKLACAEAHEVCSLSVRHAANCACHTALQIQ